MGRYDSHEPDRIYPIEFHDLNCCPVCGHNTLVILDHEFDVTTINKDGYIGEVLRADITTEIACTTCGHKTRIFCLDSEGRIKLCTEAELIHENWLKEQRVAQRAAEVAKKFVEGHQITVGLNNGENPFVSYEITEVTHF